MRSNLPSDFSIVKPACATTEAPRRGLSRSDVGDQKGCRSAHAAQGVLARIAAFVTLIRHHCLFLERDHQFGVEKHHDLEIWILEQDNVGPSKCGDSYQWVFTSLVSL